MTVLANQGRRYLSVAETLRAMLEQGRWQVGERLPAERQLAEELDVPRATVREALIVLEVEGRVEVRQMSGIYALPVLPHASVSGASPLADIGPFELLRARQVVESAIAAAAALTVSDDQINAMRDALAREEIDIAEGRGSYEGDADFHRLVAESTQNEALVATSEGLWSIRGTSPLWARIHLRIFDQTYRRQWTHDHREILRGLERRDPETARAAMWRHLGNVSDTLLTLSDPEFILQGKTASHRRALRSMQ
jgi:GntR family transcriptional regulator, uxu operon transcriptional repressor